MITVSHISKRYPGGYEALRNVSTHVDPGEMVFVTGHSGAGKSTLLKLIGGIERPTSGSVVINGKNISEVTFSTIFSRLQINKVSWISAFITIIGFFPEPSISQILVYFFVLSGVIR